MLFRRAWHVKQAWRFPFMRLYWEAAPGSRSSEIRKTRPCVVVSVKVLNEKRRTVIVVPLSSATHQTLIILFRVDHALDRNAAFAREVQPAWSSLRALGRMITRAILTLPGPAFPHFFYRLTFDAVPLALGEFEVVAALGCLLE